MTEIIKEIPPNFIVIGKISIALAFVVLTLVGAYALMLIGGRGGYFPNKPKKKGNRHENLA